MTVRTSPAWMIVWASGATISLVWRCTASTVPPVRARNWTSPRLFPTSGEIRLDPQLVNSLQPGGHFESVIQQLVSQSHDLVIQAAAFFQVLMQALLNVGQDLALPVFGQITLGIRLGAYGDPDSRVQLHDSSLLQDGQGTPDGLR